MTIATTRTWQSPTWGTLSALVEAIPDGYGRSHRATLTDEAPYRLRGSFVCVHDDGEDAALQHLQRTCERYRNTVYDPQAEVWVPGPLA